jgi:hypothetical protein
MGGIRAAGPGEPLHLPRCKLIGIRASIYLMFAPDQKSEYRDRDNVSKLFNDGALPKMTRCAGYSQCSQSDRNLRVFLHPTDRAHAG